MGSSDSKEDKDVIDTDAPTETKKEFQIVDAIQNCLSQLPLKGPIGDDEAVIEDLVTTLQKIKVKAHKDVILKYSDGLGIYIIKKGSVEVVSEDGDATLSTLSEGQFFGEVSTLYDVPCTARVKALTDCELVLLKKEVLLKHTKGSVSADPLDWFVSRTYYPTSAVVNRSKMLRRLCFRTLKRVSVFANWSDSALRTLIMSMESDLVLLYPPRSTILDHGDPPVLMYIVIRGRVRVRTEDHVLADISADRDPVAFNEEGIRFMREACYRLQAKTCCLVIPIRMKQILEAMSKEGRQKALAPWKHRQRSWTRREGFLESDMYRHKPAELQLELLAKELKRTEVFRDFSMTMLYELALMSNVCHYEKRSVAEFPKQSDSPVVVVVLMGSVKIKPESGKAYTLQTSTKGQSLYPLDWDEGYTMKASTDCLLLEISRDNAMALTSGGK